MKLKQIEAILKAEKTIIVSETAACQWIGNGATFYPVYNLPKLTQNNIFTMFDIAEDKRKNFYFEERALPSYFNFNNIDECEQILDRGAITFNADGRTLEPLKTSRGIAFINAKYLKPFAGSETGYELYERTDELGRPYVVVKSGFMLIGVISPYDLISEGFIDTIETILDLSRVALSNKHRINNDSKYKQIELGEVIK